MNWTHLPEPAAGFCWIRVDDAGDGLVKVSLYTSPTVHPFLPAFQKSWHTDRRGYGLDPKYKLPDGVLISPYLAIITCMPCQFRRAKLEVRTMTIQKVAVSEVAKLLALLPTSVVADLFDCWIGVWDESEERGYTHFQAEIVERLFNELYKLRQDAVELAQSR